MDKSTWYTWCNEVVTSLVRQTQSLNNIQETLDSYNKLTKRMLWVMMLTNTGLVILNGLLLHYNGYWF